MAVCSFKYDERWPDILPQLSKAVRSGDTDVIAEIARILEDRDQQLEDFIANRVTCDCACDGGDPPPQ